jgi:hypothetical protein
MSYALSGGSAAGIATRDFTGSCVREPRLEKTAENYHCLELHIFGKVAGRLALLFTPVRLTFTCSSLSLKGSTRLMEQTIFLEESGLPLL